MAFSGLNKSVPMFALLAAALLGVAAAAQTSRENLPIVLEARTMEGEYRDNTAVWRDVVITQGDMRIEANEARVVGELDFDNSKWTISGNVRIKAEGGQLRSERAIVSFKNKLIAQATITGA